MKKHTFKTAFALTLSLFMLVGCGFFCAAATADLSKNPDGSEPARLSGTVGASNMNASAEAATLSTPDTSVSKRDSSGEYDASVATTLYPADNLTISEAGIYILSGKYEGMILIEAGEDEKVQLVLKNAALTNEDGPAIYVRSADKVFITAAEGTVNTISDGSAYSLIDDDTALDAAVFSRDDLTINGTGELIINGNYKHAVVSKDDLIVTTKDLTVNAANVGLNGKDSVKLSDATVSITAGSDGIRSESGTDADTGFVYVMDSAVTIVSGKDGIQAETSFIAENTAINITTGSGSNTRSTDTTESFKGIKAGISIIIDGGSYQINALDDAIHTNGSLRISAGEFTLQSRDDGIHANGMIEISNGTMDISAFEGIEATYILISGGDITIQASDDGINGAHKSSQYTPTVEITGGTVTVTMSAGDTDGIDSNGNVIITGGTVSVNGNSAFDYDGSVTFTGGTVYVNGQQVSTLPNQMMGGRMGGFGGGRGEQGSFGGHGWFGDQNGFGGFRGGNHP